MQFQAILTSIALVAGLMLPHASALAAPKAKPRPQTADDAAILEMNQAFKKGDRRRLSALLPQVQGHVLEPWGAYWELAARLDEAGPTEIMSFLARYAGTYQEDRLRNDWLLLLGKRRDWATFAAEYPRFRMNDDRSVRCYALLNEAQSSGTDVAAQVQELWLAQKEADEGCAAAADQQLQADKLKPHTAWLRARLGFENEKPRIAAQAVGLLNPDWVASVNAIYANPVRFLDDKITALRPRTKELVTLALVRLASTDTTAAMDEMNKVRWRTQLTQEERSWVWGVIGKRAARRLTEGAINQFAHAQDQYLNGDHLAWKVRAALRAGAWQEVLNATAAMPEAQRQDPAWVYWRARALLALGGKPEAPAQARALFESIASPRGFYEQLALEELGRAITVPPNPSRRPPPNSKPRAATPACAAGSTPSRPGCVPRACANGTTASARTSAAACPTASCWPPPSWPATTRCGTAASTPASAPSLSSTSNSASPCRSEARWCSAPARSNSTRPTSTA